MFAPSHLDLTFAWLHSVIHGKVVKVNIAKAMKVEANPNRAGKSIYWFLVVIKIFTSSGTVWESEEWLKEHTKSLDESGGGGIQATTRPDAMEE